MRLERGTRLGPYEILSPLGAGGMGEVYRARDSRLHRDVAIKVLPAAFANGPDRLARFEQEGRALSALNHPNILAIYDIGEHDGSPFLVTELVEGKTLREALEPAGTRLSIRRAVDCGLQVAQALAAAHARGVLHRDLKPENIIIAADGHVKVLDFGLARLVMSEPPAAAAATRGVTGVGTVLGSIGYMPPEQVRGHAVDHRADLFALGCVLYEMLGGRRAFDGDTAADRTTAVLVAEPPELSKDRADIPVALERLVFRCLEKDPANRFQSAADLAFALQTAVGSSTAAADVPGKGFAIGGARERRLSRRERSAWTIAILALVAATVFALRGRSTEGSAAPDASRVIRSEIDPPPGAGGAGIPEISPDGQYLVFHALSGGMWLRALNDASAKRLTGVDDGYRACWSPDSRSVAIVGGNRLRLVAVPAGQVSTVGPAPWIATSCAWSARGEILISSILMPLVAVRVSDGTTRSLGLTNLAPGPANYVFSNFLSDRRHFVFAVNGSQQPDVNGVYIGDMDDRDAPVKLSSPGAFPPVFAGGGLTLIIRGGVLFARGLDTEHHRFTGEPAPLIEGVGTTNGAGLSVSANGLLVLDQQVFSVSARVDVLDRKGQTIRTLDERASAFAVAPDGSRVLLAKTNGLWLTDLNRPAPIRLSSDGRSYLAASWSADGNSVTYTRVGLGGGPVLYQRSVSVDDEKQVFASSGDVYARNLMPTSAGAVIALLPKRVGSSFDLMRLGANGALTPFVQTLDNEGSAAVSADGRWVSYESDAGGQWNVYVKAAAGASPPTRITQTGGRQPRWRKDSRELYYLTPDLRVASVNIDTSREPLRVGETTELFRYPSKIDWQSILRALYPVFDVTGDGQYFVVRVETDIPKPLVLIQNWPALLKRP